LLRRITVLAWEEMDQPLKDINHKVVVRLVRVLIAARREKHMEMRVWVERRKVENWLAREVLREWRRTMKKTAHVSYLPIWREGNGGEADCKSAIRQIENLRYDPAVGEEQPPGVEIDASNAPGRGPVRKIPFDVKMIPV
jgi:hypothetical protein